MKFPFPQHVPSHLFPLIFQELHGIYRRLICPLCSQPAYRQDPLSFISIRKAARQFCLSLYFFSVQQIVKYCRFPRTFRVDLQKTLFHLIRYRKDTVKIRITSLIQCSCVARIAVIHVQEREFLIRIDMVVHKISRSAFQIGNRHIVVLFQDHPTVRHDPPQQLVRMYLFLFHHGAQIPEQINEILCKCHMRPETMPDRFSKLLFALRRQNRFCKILPVHQIHIFRHLMDQLSLIQKYIQINFILLRRKPF